LQSATLLNSEERRLLPHVAMRCCCCVAEARLQKPSCFFNPTVTLHSVSGLHILDKQNPYIFHAVCIILHIYPRLAEWWYKGRRLIRSKEGPSMPTQHSGPRQGLSLFVCLHLL
jgi:hypothetical protein